MDDKSFSSLNGYELKDAEARERIEAIETQLGIEKDGEANE